MFYVLGTYHRAIIFQNYVKIILQVAKKMSAKYLDPTKKAQKNVWEITNNKLSSSKTILIHFKLAGNVKDKGGSENLAGLQTHKAGSHQHESLGDKGIQ